MQLLPTPQKPPAASTLAIPEATTPAVCQGHAEQAKRAAERFAANTPACSPSAVFVRTIWIGTDPDIQARPFEDTVSTSGHCTSSRGPLPSSQLKQAPGTPQAAFADVSRH